MLRKQSCSYPTQVGSCHVNPRQVLFVWHTVKQSNAVAVFPESQIVGPKLDTRFMSGTMRLQLPGVGLGSGGAGGGGAGGGGGMRSGGGLWGFGGAY